MADKPTIAPGDVIDGRYRIERLLGQGGMGAVYVAEELELGRRVAIKVLLPDAAANPEAVSRFEREGRAAAALESDHVTRIFSVGRLASGEPYIVMELLDGKDLADTLAERGPLPVPEVVHAIIDACDALAEAHARGIVHRDLKPANLFFAKRANGNVTLKVLDFGISKTTGSITGTQAKGLTATSALMGTPHYMSPEQLREARDVDGRTDLWALGVTMYELLVGRIPFHGQVLADVCIAVLMNVHPSITAQRRDVPPALEAIVDRCLAKEASARFASATELADALRALGIPRAARPDSKPSFAPPPLPVSPVVPDTGRAAPLPAALTMVPVTTSQTPEWMPPKSSMSVWGFLGIIGLVALAGLGAFAIRGGGDRSPATNTNTTSDGVGLVAAPAVVDAGALPPSSIVPLASASSHAPPVAPTPAKSANRPTPERAPAARTPIATPRPLASPKPGVAPGGPPPINFERR